MAFESFQSPAYPLPITIFSILSACTLIEMSRFRTITTSYFPSTMGIMIFYDVMDRSSFQVRGGLRRPCSLLALGYKYR
jgi:GTPase SAR1 family protein